MISFEACRLILRRYCFGPLFCTQERLQFVQRYCASLFDLFDTSYEFDVIKTIFIIGKSVRIQPARRDHQNDVRSRFFGSSAC